MMSFMLGVSHCHHLSDWAVFSRHSPNSSQSSTIQLQFKQQSPHTLKATLVMDLPVLEALVLVQESSTVQGHQQELLSPLL